LRVHNFNFDAGVLTIHDGKGKKDRTVPLPKVIITELLAQLERVKTLHEKDLSIGFSGVFLDHLLEKKYKNAEGTGSGIGNKVFSLPLIPCSVLSSR
jgi:integrase